MYEGCLTCQARTYCDGSFASDLCDEQIDKMIEDARIEYYREWLRYVGDDVDSL